MKALLLLTVFSVFALAHEGDDDDHHKVAVTPEPVTIGLVGVSLIGLAVAAKIKTKK